MAEEGFRDEVFDDLWVRSPDSERFEDIDVGARLCSCRNVCLAVIDDGPDKEP